MIQNESLPIWNYGRGHAITTGRITYLGGDPAAIDDPSVYRIEGALKWSRIAGPGPGPVIWMAELDADGIRHGAAVWHYGFFTCMPASQRRME